MVLCCGLVQKKSKEPVPLKDIKLHVEVNGLAAHARSTLEYTNKEDNPIEAVYIIPVDDEASVCGFRAKVGERTIVAEIQEKQEARDTYDDAIASGQTAYLMEESDDSSDILKISIGNLPAKSSVIVEVDFVLELRLEGNERAVFDFPQVLLPRYSPQGQNNRANQNENLIDQAPRVQPGEKMPYNFTFSCNVHASNPLKLVESPHQVLSVNYHSDNKRSAKVTLAEEHDFMKNIQLHIITEEPLRAYALVEEGEKSCVNNEFLSSSVVMVNFFPEFPTEMKKETPSEVIFIVDRSGSMSGSPMDSARETLLLCLKSLPANCFFNVVGFGSRFECLFSKSEKYSDQTLSKACALSKSMKADLGGTEILEPLKWVFSQAHIPGYSRQLFLLTDGGVSNTREVIKIVADNAKTTRSFSIGIGQGVSTSLVKGVAKAGNGKSEFVTSSDRLQRKVIMLLKCSLQPGLSELKVDWKVPKHFTVKQIPEEVSSLFEGEKLVMYGILEPKKGTGTASVEDVKGSAVIKGRLGLESQVIEPLSSTIPFEIKPNENISRPLHMLHHLAGKKAIQDMTQYKKCDSYEWERENTAKDELIKISKASNVISPYTSFIAVDEETLNPIETPMIRRNIPCSELVYCMGGAPPPPPSARMLYCSAQPVSKSIGGHGLMSSLRMKMKKTKMFHTKKQTKQRDACSVPSQSLDCYDVPSQRDYCYDVPSQRDYCYDVPSQRDDCYDVPSQRDDCYDVNDDMDKDMDADLYDDDTFDTKQRNVLAAPSLNMPRFIQTSSDDDIYDDMNEDTDSDMDADLYDDVLSKGTAVPGDVMMSVISLQKAAGNWDLSDKLIKLIGQTREKLNNHSVSKKLDLSKDIEGSVLATALVIIWLADKHAQKHDEWEMLSKKAKKWLESNLVKDLTSDEIMSMVSSLITC